MTNTHPLTLLMLTGISLGLALNAALADDLAEMQKKLNAEVMSQQHEVKSEGELNQNLEMTFDKNKIPKEYLSKYKGKNYGSCADLANYWERRNCYRFYNVYNYYPWGYRGW